MTVHLKLPKINAMRYLKPPKTYLCLVLPLLLSILEVLRRHHRERTARRLSCKSISWPETEIEGTKVCCRQEVIAAAIKSFDIQHTVTAGEGTPHEAAARGAWEFRWFLMAP